MGRVVTRSQRLKSLNKCNDDSNSNSGTSKRCKVISKALLPQDLMLHILTFLPLKSLLNSARYVCKHWATAIRTSQFAQAYLTHSKPGIFVTNEQHHIAYFLDIKDCVNGQFQFERTDMATCVFGTERIHLGSVMIIDTCNGILLFLRHNKHNPKQTLAFLVNPINKSYFITPLLPITEIHFEIYSQMTLVWVPHTAKFKLFFMDITDVSGVFYYVFYVLTIGIGNSWREIHRKQAPPHWDDFWKPLYGGLNYLYWITGGAGDHGITVMDVEKEIIVGNFSLASMPMDCAVEDVETFLSNSNAKFLWMGNQLSCVLTKDFKTFIIYLLDFESGIWSLYHDMRHFDHVAAFGPEFSIFGISGWIHDQIIFSIISSKKMRYQGWFGSSIHFSYSVKTRKLIKIEGLSMGDRVMLHTNSLISLPLLQHS